MKGSQGQGGTGTLEEEARSQKVEQKGRGKFMQWLLQNLKTVSPVSNEKSLNSHNMHDLPKMQMNSYRVYNKW